ncbi:MAG: hypothetical protein NW224_30715 [Leptolyngbyaceae cyanobacterium bins.302]|nr:hypothetical protein [Leptolyngbyaceae cyanobacterium bins.302]
MSQVIYPKSDLTRFQSYTEVLIQTFLERFTDAQILLGVGDQEAYQVLQTALNDHFQQRQ